MTRGKGRSIVRRRAKQRPLWAYANKLLAVPSWLALGFCFLALGVISFICEWQGILGEAAVVAYGLGGVAYAVVSAVLSLRMARYDGKDWVAQGFSRWGDALRAVSYWIALVTKAVVWPGAVARDLRSGRAKQAIRGDMGELVKLTVDERLHPWDTWLATAALAMVTVAFTLRGLWPEGIWLVYAALCFLAGRLIGYAFPGGGIVAMYRRSSGHPVRSFVGLSALLWLLILFCDVALYSWSVSGWPAWNQLSKVLDPLWNFAEIAPGVFSDLLGGRSVRFRHHEAIALCASLLASQTGWNAVVSCLSSRRGSDDIKSVVADLCRKGEFCDALDRCIQHSASGSTMVVLQAIAELGVGEVERAHKRFEAYKRERKRSTGALEYGEELARRLSLVQVAAALAPVHSDLMRKALRLLVASEPPIHVLGLACRDLWRYERLTAAQIADVLGNYPRSNPCLLVRGYMLWLCGDREQALQILERFQGGTPIEEIVQKVLELRLELCRDGLTCDAALQAVDSWVAVAGCNSIEEVVTSQQDAGVLALCQLELVFPLKCVETLRYSERLASKEGVRHLYKSVASHTEGFVRMKHVERDECAYAERALELFGRSLGAVRQRPGQIGAVG